MVNIFKCIVLVTLLSVVASCSTKRYPDGGEARQEAGDLGHLAKQWGEPKTVLTLANGNLLTVFGGGREKRMTTPVPPIPGHALVMLSQNGEPSRFVKDRVPNTRAAAPDATQRIIWIETNQAGEILLAGCAGCTQEEDRLLARQVRGKSVQNTWAKSAGYSDFRD